VNGGRVFDHVTIRVSDRNASERFYGNNVEVVNHNRG
jgi:hypothetical protein